MKFAAWCSVALAALWLAGCGTTDTLMQAPPPPDAAADARDIAATDSADAADVAPDVPPDVQPDTPDVVDIAPDLGPDLGPPAASAQFSSTELTFGPAICGAAGPESHKITVTNAGSADLFVVLALDGSSAFSVVGETSRVVPPGKSADIEVLAQPLPGDATAGVTDTATLSISTNDPSLPKLDIPLQRTATGATLVLDPPLVDFGLVPLGQESAIQVKLTNTGNLPLKVALGAPPDAQFALTWPDAPSDLSLPPGGASKTVTVHFKPTQLTASGAVVALATTGSTCGASASSLDLAGQGLAALPAVSGDVDFGAVACGAAGLPQTVTVSNAGNEAFTFTAELATGDSSPYTLSYTSTTVPGGDKVELTIAPKAVPQVAPVPGNYPDTLVVTTNLAGDPPHLIALSQAAAGAIVRADAASVTFGAVPLAANKTVPLQVRNTGSLPAHVAFSVTGKDFSVEPAGVQTLAPGAVLQASVTFAPQDTAAQAGTLAIALDPGDALCAAPPAAIPLSGVGMAGGLQLDKAQIDFGLTGCGQTPLPQTLALTNSGTAPLQWFADLGRSPSQYTVAPASSGSLAPGEGVLLTISSAAMPTSSPVTENLYGDALLLSTDVPGDPVRSVPIRQTASGAILQFTLPGMDFGSIAPGSTASGTLGVRNIGNAAATASLIGTSTAFANDFTAKTLLPGSAQPGQVTFQPPADAAPQKDGLQLQTQPGDVLCAPLPPPLAVQGQMAANGVAFAPGSLNFGEVDCGKAGTPRQIVVKNLGNASFHVGAQLAAAVPLYTVALSPQSGMVAAGGSLTVTVDPLPIPKQADITPDLFSDTLTLTTDAPGDVPHGIALRQTAHGAILTLSASSLEFGGVLLGTSGHAPLAVSNSGNAPATLGFSASLPANFALPQALGVPAGGTQAIPAWFSPQNLQIYSDSADIATPATVLCKPLALTSLTLTGLGVQKPTLKVAPDELFFGDGGYVACGQSTTQKTLTVTNLTAASVTLTATMAKGAWSAFAVSPANTTAEPGVPLTLTLTPKAIPASSLTTLDGYADSLVLKTNVPGDGKHFAWLHMTAAGAILSFDKPSLNLPATKVGKQTALAGAFHVRNAGNVPATVTMLIADPGNFALDQSAGTVSAAQSMTLAATFAPQSLGQKSTTVSLSTPAPLCALLPQPLKMTGVGK